MSSFSIKCVHLFKVYNQYTAVVRLKPASQYKPVNSGGGGRGSAGSAPNNSLGFLYFEMLQIVI